MDGDLYATTEAERDRLKAKGWRYLEFSGQWQRPDGSWASDDQAHAELMEMEERPT
jgi:hypothetical protein